MRAIRNPDLVLKTLQHAREHGVRETVELVRGAVVGRHSRWATRAAGVVVDTGGHRRLQRRAQRVACAGAGDANHAEVVSVPGNLAAVVPDGVPLRDAAFTTLGAIALQGVRRAEPELGERVVVVGLGLLGLLTRADPARGRLPGARRRAGGAPAQAGRAARRRAGARARRGGRGRAASGPAATAPTPWSICASSASDAILNQAVELVRRKGRVVPVGDIGLGARSRAALAREADVLISTSYGPGRYDPSYEEGGIDYPFAYVRWTENRNMEEFLRLLATGQVRVEPLVDLELPAERAGEAYARVNGDTPPLAAVLTYRASRARSSGARRWSRIGRASGAAADGDGRASA